MIGEINVGDMLRCLRCNQIFKLENIRIEENGEFIDCPHCKGTLDVQIYHLTGDPVQGAVHQKPKRQGVKSFKKLSSGVLCDIENILAHTELKQSLIALKEFIATCHEAGFSKDEIDDLMRYIAIVLYITHFNIDIQGAKK